MNQNTKKPAIWFTLITAVFIIAALIFYLQPESRPFNWLDLKDAKIEANKTNKLIFLNFYSKWDPISKNIENSVFMNDSIKPILNRNFILASLNISSKENQVLMTKVYKIQNLPSFLILDKHGKEITRFSDMPIGQELMFQKWLNNTSYNFVASWKSYKEAKKAAINNDKYLMVLIIRQPQVATSIYNIFNNNEITNEMMTEIELTYLISTYDKDNEDIKAIGDSACNQNEILLFDKQLIKRLNYQIYHANENLVKEIKQSFNNIKNNPNDSNVIDSTKSRK